MGNVIIKTSIILFLISGLINAQIINEKKSGLDVKRGVKKIASKGTTGKVIIWDEDNNEILKFNDEGKSGSITLPPLAITPSESENKLYNVNGTLNFNGTPVGGVDKINDLSDAKSDEHTSVFLGLNSGFSDDGSFNKANTGVGIASLYSNIVGNYNTAIGYSAMYKNNGNKNTAIGYNALRHNVNGYGNVAIGFSAGYNETGNNKLYIENTESSIPLIGGDFAADEVYLNAKVGIGTQKPLFKLHLVDAGGGHELAMFHNTVKEQDSDGIVVKAGPNSNPGNGVDYVIFQDGDGTTIGTIDGDGSGGVRFNTTSDARLKTKIRDYSGALETVRKIRVRKYEMKSAPGKEEIGMIAQELLKVYPLAVSGNPDNDVSKDPMMVDYGKLTPLLLRAVQELYDENLNIKNELIKFKKEFMRNQVMLKQVMNFLKINSDDFIIQVSQQ